MVNNKKDKKEMNFKKFKKKIRKKEVDVLPAFSTYIYRPISCRISYLLYKTKITPNQVSIINLFIGVIGCLCFILPKLWITGSIVLLIFIMLDYVDGELARAKNLKSERGKFLDHLAHYVMKGLLPLTLSIGLFFIYTKIFLLILGGFASYIVMLEHLILYVNLSRKNLLK